MKTYVTFVFIFLSFSAFGSDKESFLSAWEGIQKNSAEVAQFEKVVDRIYHIKFTTLPFEGELRVLAYDVDELKYTGFSGDEYSLSGYVELELVGAPEDLIQKYNRTYYKWAENNNLFYHSKSGRWVTGREYSESVQSELTDDTGVLFWFAEYSTYILIGLFLYILYTLFFGNKHLKTSIEQQKQALDDMEETKKHMQDALSLHKETNQILNEILKELKKVK